MRTLLKAGFLAAVAAAFAARAGLAAAGTLEGELKKWHKVTTTFDGPSTSESADPNPFRDYRLDVTFSHAATGKSYIVPGYYAADGNAAETSATSGDKWRAHFAPDETGTWTYSVSFKTGTDVAAADDPSAFSTAGYCDGEAGSFDIGATDKTGRDLRGKGLLQYVGKHHLRFAETGEYFLKCGADAPENFLAYEDFDGDFKTDGVLDNLVKTWSYHVGDWQTGDPTWQGGKGKGIIGAVSYLASEGMNVFSFLTMNIDGDDRNVFPYTTYSERYRFDCSKLDQWEIVLEHANRMGMYLHFKTQETENETLLDGGEVGTQRRLYYRELIARFSHHLALNWNLGEENGALGAVNQSTAQRQAMAQYFYDNDPYRHHIVIHNGKWPDDLLGDQSKLTGFSLQTSESDFSLVHSAVLEWINKSASSGKPWVVACDEPGDPQHSLMPDSDDPTHDNARKNALWGCIMAGGAGLEWYFGYQHDHSDLTCEDWRSRDLFWDQCRYALEFFKNNGIPFWDMHCDDALTSSTSDYCLVNNGNTIVVIYLKSGGTTDLDLTGLACEFTVEWYSPREGGPLTDGGTVTGGGSVQIGPPPSETGLDWVALVKVSGSVAVYPLTVENGSGDGSYLEGALAGVAADPAPAGQWFNRWTGDVSTVADVNSPVTTLTMPAAATTVTAAYIQAIVIECEDMALSGGYEVSVSEPYLIETTTTGTATASFPAETGAYRVYVVIVKEDDGQPTLGVSVGGTPVTTITYPLGLSGRDPEQWYVGELDINNGDEIRLDGTRVDGAAARVDKIVFVPVDTDGDGMSDSDESFYGLDPQNPDQDGNGVLDGYDDWNGNGIDNQTELANGNNPGTPPAPPSGDKKSGCSVSGTGGGGPLDLPGFAALVFLLAFCALPRRQRTRTY